MDSTDSIGELSVLGNASDSDEVGADALAGWSVLVLSVSGSEASEADDANESPVTRRIPSVLSSASDTL